MIAEQCLHSLKPSLLLTLPHPSSNRLVLCKMCTRGDTAGAADPKETGDIPYHVPSGLAIKAERKKEEGGDNQGAGICLSK